MISQKVISDTQYNHRILLLVICISFQLTGCSDFINPTAPFVRHLVVYSVLTTSSDTQYVRIATTYDPPDYNPFLQQDEVVDSTAIVSMTDGLRTYDFKFTSLSRSDTSRYKSRIGLFYAYPFRPEPTKEYTLTVSSTVAEKAFTTTIVPGRGFIATSSAGDLSSGRSTVPILVQFSLSSLTRAYLVRFYIVYTTENVGDDGREHYYEVPLIDKVLDSNLEKHFRLYPSVVTGAATVKASQVSVKTIEFQPPAYGESIYQIAHYNFNARFKRAVFYLIQFNEPWYKHYASGNLFQDRLGVRLDPPDYSNILGGVGLFGAFHVDSTVVPLPEYIRPYR